MAEAALDYHETYQVMTHISMSRHLQLLVSVQESGASEQPQQLRRPPVRCAKTGISGNHRNSSHGRGSPASALGGFRSLVMPMSVAPPAGVIMVEGLPFTGQDVFTVSYDHTHVHSANKLRCLKLW